MGSLAERWLGIWKNMRQGETRMPSRVAIPSDHVDVGRKLQGVLRRDEHYFQVRINEMYLTYGRKWWVEFDPVVFVVSEFTYDKKMEAVPFVVGPMMLEKYGQKLPTGMIFSDTRVAGLHPYVGGRLNLSIVLCRVGSQSYAKKLLQVVEGAANVLDFSTSLSTYLKIASVIVDGTETLLGSGDIKPLIGYRKEFDPDAGDLLEEGYYALIDTPESELNADELWVNNNRLFYGKSLADADPFRAADYVLYSITQSTERTDIATLPFYPLWEKVKEEATVPVDDSWKRAKANMLTLFQTMVLSPDLASKHVDELTDSWINEMKELHERAVNMATLGPMDERTLATADSRIKKATKILDL